MSQLRDIKDRIDSVKKTRKMTQAMKMVAAAKFKRFSVRALSSRSILGDLDLAIAHVIKDQNGLITSDFITKYDAQKELLVFITGDRGLCGGFNSNIIKFVKNYIEESSNSIDMIVVGRKGIQFFKKLSTAKIVEGLENFQETLSIETVQNLLDLLVEKYKTGEYSAINLFYNEFISAISSNVIKKQLFPVNWSDKDLKSDNSVIILEPSPAEVFDNLCKKYFFNALYNAFLESFAAEQGARMAAMDSATDNAGDMIKDLTLIYNRKRQAQITTELSEIVAGAEALVG